jgi:outer membrane biosynthesis protein TonB
MAETSTEKPQVYFVRHLARDPETRAQRRLRPTNRLAFLLGDGRRIRRKNVRATELDQKTLEENIDKLVEGVKYSFIQVTSSSGEVMSTDDLMAAAGKKAPEPKAEASEPKAEAPEPAPEPEAKPQPAKKATKKKVPNKRGKE